MTMTTWMKTLRMAALAAVSLPLAADCLPFTTASQPQGAAPAPAAAPVPGNLACLANRRAYRCYRSFWPQLEMTREFATMGITTRCFFAANAINSAGFEYCKYPLIWKGVKKYDFAAFDAQVDDLLKASPNAEFLCMIDLNTPYWLTRRFALDSFADISHAAAIPEWRALTTEWMKDFIAYAERKYGDRICAYILSGGGTSEWYEYDRGRTSRAKNAAWRQWCRERGLQFGDMPPPETTLHQAAYENVLYDPATEGAKIAYWRFHNWIIADALLDFAKTARSVIPARKEIGAFFGYYLVTDDRITSFGHLDYDRVFASPDIDFFIAPGTYNDRMMGGGSGSQLVQGSVLRHGKRFLHEIDYRTHLVDTKCWHTTADDIAGNTREAAFALINHGSLWWFDMWGGFYEEAPTRDRIRLMDGIASRFQDDLSPSAAQVLYVADPESAYYGNENSEQFHQMSQHFRNKLNRIGAPFDCFSFDDLAAIDLSQYKVICLPGTFLITPEREKILRERVLRDGRTVIWAYAPGICDGRTLDAARIQKWAGVPNKTKGITTTRMPGWTAVYAADYALYTPAALQKICRQAGAILYTEDLIPVYANTRLVCIHCKDGGKKRIQLPRKVHKVISLIDQKTVAEETDHFDFDFASPDTRLFELQ